MRRRDPQDGAVEVPERFLGDDRADLGAPAAQARVLLHGEQPAGLRHRSEDRGGVQRYQAAEVDDGHADALGRETVGRLQRPRHHQGQSHHGGIRSLPQHTGRSQLVDDLARGDLALRGVERLVLEQQHGIGIADRGGHQPDQVLRRGRRDHLHAGDGHRPVLDALRVLGAEAQARAVAGPDDQRAADHAVGHVARLRDLVGDEVPAHREEVREHDLGDGPQPRHRRSHGGAEDGLLGDRRVDDPVGSELLEQPGGGLEDAPGPAHVLTEEHDGLVSAHLLGDAGRHRLPVGQFRHCEPPSAQTFVQSASAGGSGALLAAAVARSISAATS